MKQKKTPQKTVGHFVKQPKGYVSFIPAPFPSKELITFDGNILLKSEEARSRMSYLDGIAHHIPDIHFFIYMYLNKDATASSQIEGTNANFTDVLEAEVRPSYNSDKDDVDDIVRYVRGLERGLRDLENIPLAERVILSSHKILMFEARKSSFNVTPGFFRTSQNWIGGRNIQEARFIPPPHTELPGAIGDLEKFIHAKKIMLSPVIQAALIHAQFEAIHPFFDGNGRTGRMLVTLFFVEKNIMEKPLLYLSHYFRKHRDEYYERLLGYSRGEVDAWVEFFLDGVIEIAEEAAKTIEKISKLRERDRNKIVQTDKRTSENIIKIVENMYRHPVTTSVILQKRLNISRTKVETALERMVNLDIINRTKIGDRTVYRYDRYMDIFR